MMKTMMCFMATAAIMVGCGASQKRMANSEQPVGPAFQADSAYAFCEQQCDFGPRTMNSEAHELCGQWIVRKFQSYGMAVSEQRATLKGFDGTALLSNNITAHYQPECEQRVMLCAHWDSRPWADNDPDEANHTKPVMAANDGASGVAVMLEIARLLQADSTRLPIGVDFVCFDAEDWGSDDVSDSWALGAQYWAQQYRIYSRKERREERGERREDSLADEDALASLPTSKGALSPLSSLLSPLSSFRYAILLDMVGGQGARFYQEGYSKYYANHVVKRVWKAAGIAGYSSYFPMEDGGTITDDHGPVNEIAGIPCIDIINYYPGCEQSCFGPTWHTVSDDMAHIDRQTLKAVGQTLVQVLWSEEGDNKR